MILFIFFYFNEIDITSKIIALTIFLHNVKTETIQFSQNCTTKCSILSIIHF